MPRRAVEVGKERSAQRIFFGLIAVGFLAGALLHAAAIVNPAIAEPSPAWRHALFIGINLAVAAGCVTRPRWFVWLFGALVAQQLWSHGTYAREIWRDEHRVDWASVVVLLSMPAVLVLLARDNRRARATRKIG